MKERESQEHDDEVMATTSSGLEFGFGNEVSLYLLEKNQLFYLAPFIAFLLLLPEFLIPFFWFWYDAHPCLTPTSTHTTIIQTFHWGYIMYYKTKTNKSKQQQQQQ